MQIITPAATGENNKLINSVLDVVTENAVMAISPITRPKVPASVAKSPEEKLKWNSVEINEKIYNKLINEIWNYKSNVIMKKKNSDFKIKIEIHKAEPVSIVTSK